MAELFQRDRTVIVRHIHNIYKSHEFDQSSTCAKNAQVALTLMVPESKPQEKDLIVNMTINLINKKKI